jgi:hypothetical protein
MNGAEQWREICQKKMEREREEDYKSCGKVKHGEEDKRMILHCTLKN